MIRVVLAFVIVALIYPLIAMVTGGAVGGWRALDIGTVTLPATFVLGLIGFALFSRRGWLDWWEVALGGAVIGLFCATLLALGDARLFPVFAPTFLGLGAAHGLLFWFLAIWRNAALTRRLPGTGHRRRS